MKILVSVLLSMVISLAAGLAIGEDEKICECEPGVAVCYDTRCNKGLCIDSGEFSKCYCNPGYQGKFCDQTQNSAMELTDKRFVDPITLTAIIGAITGVVSAGTSIGLGAEAASQAAGYRVRVKLEIENFSKWSLTSPVTQVQGGVIPLQPRRVAPGEKESMVMRKTGDTATGSYGTVSWNVGGLEDDVIVMWSAPYSFDFHSNWLAVGVLHGKSNSQDRFDEMYDGSPSYFQRAEYYSQITTVRYCYDKICISGTMGTGHHSEIHITVYPKYEKDLAPGDVKNAYSKEKDSMNP